MHHYRCLKKYLLFISLLFNLILLLLSTNLNFTKTRRVYVITPTYNRAVQKAELTRLSHTFRLAGNIHWIVVEDANKISKKVESLLIDSGVKHTLLAISTPDEHIPVSEQSAAQRKPRGVMQRNLALNYIRDILCTSGDFDSDGLVYFADDDNTYSIALFDEIRKVKSIGVWPVAFVGGLIVEKPIVSDGKVVAFNAVWAPQRPFAIDMAGFAVSIENILKQANALFPMYEKTGYLETHFLKALGFLPSDLEALGDECSKVLVWHTRAERFNAWAEKVLHDRGKSSYAGIEV